MAAARAKALTPPSSSFSVSPFVRIGFLRRVVERGLHALSQRRGRHVLPLPVLHPRLRVAFVLHPLELQHLAVQPPCDNLGGVGSLRRELPGFVVLVLVVRPVVHHDVLPAPPLGLAARLRRGRWGLGGGSWGLGGGLWRRTRCSPGVPCDDLAANSVSMWSSVNPIDLDTAAQSSSSVAKFVFPRYRSSSGAKHCTSSFSVTTSWCSVHSAKVRIGTSFRRSDPPLRMASGSALTTSLCTVHRIWPVGSPTTIFLSPHGVVESFKIATHRRWHRVLLHPPLSIHSQFVLTNGLVGSNTSTSMVSSALRHDPSLNAQCCRRLICQCFSSGLVAPGRCVAPAARDPAGGLPDGPAPSPASILSGSFPRRRASWRAPAGPGMRLCVAIRRAREKLSVAFCLLQLSMDCVLIHTITALEPHQVASIAPSTPPRTPIVVQGHELGHRRLLPRARRAKAPPPSRRSRCFPT